VLKERWNSLSSNNDVWIAALYRQRSLPLLSRDRHFDAVSGIMRIDWQEFASCAETPLFCGGEMSASVQNLRWYCIFGYSAPDCFRMDLGSAFSHSAMTSWKIRGWIPHGFFSKREFAR
jgi:hypothetical protein